jgi:PhnB protein
VVGAASWRVLAYGFEAGLFVEAMGRFGMIVFIGSVLLGILGMGIGAIAGRIWEVVHRRRHPPRDAAEPAASRLPAPPPPPPRVIVRKAPDQIAIPFLVVPNVPALVTFIHDAFGGRETQHVVRADRSILHAEMQIGTARVMLAEPSDDLPAQAGAVYLSLDDGEAAFARAVAAGAEVVREPADLLDSDERAAAVRDASGTTWWIAFPATATSK